VPDQVFDIRRRFAAEAKGLVSKPGEQRLLDANEAEVRRLICRRPPNGLGLPFALWSRAAVREFVLQCCGVRLAVRAMGTYLARWASPPRSRSGAPTTRPSGRCCTGCGGTTRPLSREPSRPEVSSSGGDETSLRSDDVRARS
jgi:hypothetical protein